MSNTRHWDNLGRTDPAHTKGFKRSGGFSGTAIKPIWMDRRLTETFGPCGEGWGIDKPEFTVVPGPEGEVLVYCTVSCWWQDGTTGPHYLHGVGGDSVVKKNKYGLTGDDEAFKKAFTDAIGNAFKHLGVAADVHMGQFDDSKYVQEIAAEFRAEKAANDPAILELATFEQDIGRMGSLADLEALLAKHMPTIEKAALLDAAKVSVVRQKYAARKHALAA